jgi:YadA-like membrane anchor domain
MGTMATASNGGAAYGDNSIATGALSSALGPGASATFANSTAIGNGAATTRINQVAIGTGTNTYTLAGINSAASLAAQSGTLRVVTTDAAGNLASAPFPSGGGGPNLSASVATLQTQIKQAFEGTAIAIALGGTALPGDKRYAVSVNWGNFRGENAMSLSTQFRVTDYVVLNAGFAAGFAQGGVGSRAGVTFAW